MLSWINKKKKQTLNAVSNDKHGSSDSVELSIAIQRSEYFPGDTVYGAAFVFLERTSSSGGTGGFASTPAAVGGTALPTCNVSSLRLMASGDRIVRMGIHDHIHSLYQQEVRLYPPDSLVSDPAGGGAPLTGEMRENTVAEVQMQSSFLLQLPGSYVFPFRFPLPAMLPWSEEITTPPLVGIRSSTRFSMVLEIEINEKKVCSPRLVWKIRPLPLPFWRWNRLKHADYLMMPEERRLVLQSTFIGMTSAIHTFGDLAQKDSQIPPPPPLPQQETTDDGLSEAQGSHSLSHRKHRHRRHKNRDLTSAEGDRECSSPGTTKFSDQGNTSSREGDLNPQEGGGERKRRHKHRHKHRSKPFQDEMITQCITPHLSREVSVEREDNQTPVSFDTQPSRFSFGIPSEEGSRPCNMSPPQSSMDLKDPSLLPFDKVVALPLRTSIIHKTNVHVPIKLSSTLLVPGGRPLLVEYTLDTSQEIDISIVTKIKAFLNVRYTFFTPTVQKMKLCVASECSRTMKPSGLLHGPLTETIRLVIPSDTPLSILSETTQVESELCLKFYTHSTLKDFESKIIIPVVLVGGVDRTSFSSRRMGFWTNNFLHQSVPKSKDLLHLREDPNRITACPLILQSHRSVVVMDPHQMELIVHCVGGGSDASARGYANLDRREKSSACAAVGREEADTLTSVSTIPHFTTTGLFSYATLMKITTTDDPGKVVYIPLEDPTTASPGQRGKFFDPNPFQHLM